MMVSIVIRIFSICQERDLGMSVDLGLSGKKFLVTGASSGIGQATAIHISKLGARVVLSGRNEERLRRTLSQMDGDGHFAIPFDLTDFEGSRDYVKKCIEADGQRFDGMVYSAGTGGGGLIRMLNISEMINVMYLNFCSYAMMLKEFSSRKVVKERGSIVAISSRAAIFPGKSQGCYAASKAAMDTISEVAAKEFANRKIRVNTVRPENVDTPAPAAAQFFKSVSAEKKKEWYPLGTLETKDITGVIAFLLSDLSNKITGQHIYVSGGNFGSEIDFLL